MSTIKIEFPADRPDIANHLGAALVALSHDRSHIIAPKSITPHEEQLEQVEEPAAVEAPQVQDTESGGAPEDRKGVAFDGNYCAQAKDPFYASGKREGQWKKKKGVDEDDYDAWYAAELSALPDPMPAVDRTAVNTASAFGSATPAPEEPEAPKEVGQFMVWVSEKQAAGLLTQDQINEAWTQAAVTMNDLFTRPPEEVEQNIKKVFDILAAQCGA